jgi:hypothetical protein
MTQGEYAASSWPKYVFAWRGAGRIGVLEECEPIVPAELLSRLSPERFDADHLGILLDPVFDRHDLRIVRSFSGS